jgi:hypothetical protein
MTVHMGTIATPKWTDLPTDENGAVAEDGEGIEAIDEIEPFDVGETESLAMELDGVTAPSSATSTTRKRTRTTTTRG